MARGIRKRRGACRKKKGGEGESWFLIQLGSIFTKDHSEILYKWQEQNASTTRGLIQALVL